MPERIPVLEAEIARLRRAAQRSRVWERVAYAWLIALTVVGLFAVVEENRDETREQRARSLENCTIANQTRAAVIDMLGEILTITPMTAEKQQVLDTATSSLRPIDCRAELDEAAE